MNAKTCYHCGDSIDGIAIKKANKDFCCIGCKSVYTLLNDHHLGEFYTYEKNPGFKPNSPLHDKYKFLELDEISKRFITYEDDDIIKITLSLPSIHCSSCIYLLENSAKINPAIISCQVHFLKKEASITFNKNKTKLSEIALFLDRIGYTPNFNSKQSHKVKDNNFLFKIGIAGFAFGSIMLWSTPSYFGIAEDNQTFRDFTTYLSFIISLPVLLYSSRDYFISAYKALRTNRINLDIPITLGIIALYLQSIYSIFTHEGPGYLDSFAGLIFFLLIGKWFQNISYQSLNFDRDNTSYFPVAVTRILGETEEIIPLEKVKTNDIVQIKNEEIIPCDAELLSERAEIDYSFVTGESKIIKKVKGDLIYAGGKLIGQYITLKALSSSDRSQITQLWNEVKNKKEHNPLISYQDKISYFFLIILISLATVSSIIWYFIEPSMIPKVLISILIVACPCALALSAPFTLGNISRILGRKGLYIKNTSVIEALLSITTIVFDKTGTLSDPSKNEITSLLDALDTEDQNMLQNITKSSTHPLSKFIYTYYPTEFVSQLKFDTFEEIKGSGIKAEYKGHNYKIGNASFTKQKSETDATEVFYTKDGVLLQHFTFKSHFRTGILEMLYQLKNYKIYVLSGDNDQDKKTLISLGFEEKNIRFNQEAKDKFEIINALNQSNEKVLMIGDGLNDSGALAAAQVGIALSEDMFRFTPNSDGILSAKMLTTLPSLLKIAKFSTLVLKICLAFSICYNIIGLSFAISGNLSPLIAAILMPISSITVVVLSTLIIQIRYRKTQY
jgi:Cu+-exporting ATPase